MRDIKQNAWLAGTQSVRVMKGMERLRNSNRSEETILSGHEHKCNVGSTSGLHLEKNKCTNGKTGEITIKYVA